jgi:hypothetical protein
MTNFTAEARRLADANSNSQPWRAWGPYLSERQWGTVLAATSAFAEHSHTSAKFEGGKANSGTVTHTVKHGKNVLTLSDDFKVPETPAPHWQVVDSKGNVYLLQRLKIKGDKINKSIIVPSYVQDVAKVQIWCAWAEALLGETSFEQPVQVTSR